jgi:hypothetical protein
MNDVSKVVAALDPGKRRRMARMTYGAIIGGAMGFVLTALALQLLGAADAAAALSAAQALAVIFAAATTAIGAILLTMAFSRRLYEIENQSSDSDPEDYRDASPMLRMSGISLIATGIEFGALAIPPAWQMGAFVLPVVLAAIAVQLWAGIHIWTRSDELQRAVILEGSALSVTIIMLLLSLWAPLAIYGYTGFDPLAVVALIAIANLAPTLWISHRRGL